MKVRCPSCRNQVDMPEEAHYQVVPCPLCGEKFQLVSESTQQVSREFLSEVLKDLEKKPQ